ncbi:Gfo/Idh/MocA family protein [Dactylosporangium matsuzakiense]|uniref:Oxidoreductase n=1 Tax=Dactylosporangium matsuzakiense TaxID=53360 RepID=A0A9W6KMW6_9ACTN|nr:Gfo/Idh/MocA family oxidoreductase [Dactylosporangium matsuzakiense]UWZ42692.1 Gfo/Idh/MocA family oxidoreductase [Dactylosporangium matsuzakiense]GLL03825.1 oxidoreductase [Dactylosporangium matsuzakiense]
MTTTVALIGAAGHGAWHLRALDALGDRVRLVATCDVQPGYDYTDHRTMLAERRPEVVIVCTPPHTHLPIALDVLDAGCDLLLEKPPVLNLADHRTLAGAARGRVLQVNFQALGSPTMPMLAERVGAVHSASVAGAWWRPDEYWRRSSWSGRRGLDGALVNPFAHALMQALAITGLRPPWTFSLDRYRTRPDVEVEDTATLRLTGPDGRGVFVAVTLCSGEFVPGDITVTGSAGTVEVGYAQDRLDGEVVPGRIGLLENLLDHREHDAPLLAPLARTEPFVALAEAILAAPDPVLLDPARLARREDGPEIPGAAALVRRAAAERAHFREIGAFQ